MGEGTAGVIHLMVTNSGCRDYVVQSDKYTPNRLFVVRNEAEELAQGRVGVRQSTPMNVSTVPQRRGGGVHVFPSRICP